MQGLSIPKMSQRRFLKDFSMGRKTGGLRTPISKRLDYPGRRADSGFRRSTANPTDLPAPTEAVRYFTV